MEEDNSGGRKGQKRKREELRSYPPAPSKRRAGEAPKARLETIPEEDETAEDNTGSNAKEPPETAASRPEIERGLRLAASGSSLSRVSTAVGDEASDISSIRGRRKQESLRKCGFSLEFENETQSVTPEGGETTTPSPLNVEFDIFVGLFKKYLRALRKNQNDMMDEMRQRNLETSLIVCNENEERVLNRELVKWIFETYFLGTQISLDDSLQTATKAARKAEQEVMAETGNQKGTSSQKDKEHVFFPSMKPDPSPSISPRPINDGTSTPTRDVCNELVHIAISPHSEKEQHEKIITSEKEEAASRDLLSIIQKSADIPTLQHSEKERHESPLTSETGEAASRDLLSIILRSVEIATSLQSEKKSQENHLICETEKETSSDLQSIISRPVGILTSENLKKESHEKTLTSETEEAASSDLQSITMKSVDIATSRHSEKVPYENPLTSESEEAASSDFQSIITKSVDIVTSENSEKEPHEKIKTSETEEAASRDLLSIIKKSADIPTLQHSEQEPHERDL